MPCWRWCRLPRDRDVIAGAAAAAVGIDLVADGFAPLENELTVLTGVQPSGTVREHQGAAPAAIVDVLVDGLLGHDGVAFTFGGTRLGS